MFTFHSYLVSIVYSAQSDSLANRSQKRTVNARSRLLLRETKSGAQLRCTCFPQTNNTSRQREEFFFFHTPPSNFLSEETVAVKNVQISASSTLRPTVTALINIVPVWPNGQLGQGVIVPGCCAY